MSTNRAPHSQHFNGWQRLWVIFVVASGLATVGFTALKWPSDSDLLEARAVLAVELGLKVIAARAKIAGNERDELSALRALEKGPYKVRHENYGDLSAEQVLARIEPLLKDTDELNALEARRMQDRETTAKSRRDYVGLAATAWLVTAAFLYVVGWSIAWVRRGFAPR